MTSKNPTKDEIKTQVKEFKEKLNELGFDELKALQKSSNCFPAEWNLNKGSALNRREFMSDHAYCYILQSMNADQACVNKSPSKKKPATYGTQLKSILPSKQAEAAQKEKRSRSLSPGAITRRGVNEIVVETLTGHPAKSTRSSKDRIEKTMLNIRPKAVTRASPSPERVKRTEQQSLPESRISFMDKLMDKQVKPVQEQAEPAEQPAKSTQKSAKPAQKSAQKASAPVETGKEVSKPNGRNSEVHDALAAQYASLSQQFEDQIKAQEDQYSALLEKQAKMIEELRLSCKESQEKADEHLNKNVAMRKEFVDKLDKRDKTIKKIRKDNDDKTRLLQLHERTKNLPPPISPAKKVEEKSSILSISDEVLEKRKNTLKKFGNLNKELDEQLAETRKKNVDFRRKEKTLEERTLIESDSEKEEGQSKSTIILQTSTSKKKKKTEKKKEKSKPKLDHTKRSLTKTPEQSDSEEKPSETPTPELISPIKVTDSENSDSSDSSVISIKAQSRSKKPSKSKKKVIDMDKILKARLAKQEEKTLKLLEQIRREFSRKSSKSSKKAKTSKDIMNQSVFNHDILEFSSAESADSDIDWEASEFDLYNFVETRNLNFAKYDKELGQEKKNETFRHLKIPFWDDERHPNVYEYLRNIYLELVIKGKKLNRWDYVYFIVDVFESQHHENIKQVIRETCRELVEKQIDKDALYFEMKKIETAGNLTLPRTVIEITHIRRLICWKIAGKVQCDQIRFSPPVWKITSPKNIENHVANVVEIVQMKDGLKSHREKASYRQLLEAVEIIIRQCYQHKMVGIVDRLFEDNEFQFWYRGETEKAQELLRVTDLCRTFKLIYQRYQDHISRSKTDWNKITLRPDIMMTNAETVSSKTANLSEVTEQASILSVDQQKALASSGSTHSVSVATYMTESPFRLSPDKSNTPQKVSQVQFTTTDYDEVTSVLVTFGQAYRKGVENKQSNFKNAYKNGKNFNSSNNWQSKLKVFRDNKPNPKFRKSNIKWNTDNRRKMANDIKQNLKNLFDKFISNHVDAYLSRNSTQKRSPKLVQKAKDCLQLGYDFETYNDDLESGYDSDPNFDDEEFVLFVNDEEHDNDDYVELANFEGELLCYLARRNFGFGFLTIGIYFLKTKFFQAAPVDSGSQADLIDGTVVNNAKLTQYVKADDSKQLRIGGFNKNQEQLVVKQFLTTNVRIGLDSYEITFAVLPPGTLKTGILLGKPSLVKCGFWENAVEFWRQKHVKIINTCQSMQNEFDINFLSNLNFANPVPVEAPAQEIPRSVKFDSNKPEKASTSKPDSELMHKSQKSSDIIPFLNKSLYKDNYLLKPECLFTSPSEMYNSIDNTVYDFDTLSVPTHNSHAKKDVKHADIKIAAAKTSSMKKTEKSSNETALKITCNQLGIDNFGICDKRSKARTFRSEIDDDRKYFENILKLEPTVKRNILLVDAAFRQNPGWELISPENLTQCINEDYGELINTVELDIVEDSASMKIFSEEDVKLKPFDYATIQIKWSLPKDKPVEQGVYQLREKTKNDKISIIERLVDTSHAPTGTLFVMNNNPYNLRIKKGHQVAIGFKTSQYSLADVENGEDIIEKPVTTTDEGPTSLPKSASIKRARLRDQLSVNDVIRAASHIEQFTQLPLLKDVQREFPEGTDLSIQPDTEDDIIAQCFYVEQKEIPEEPNIKYVNLTDAEMDDLITKYKAERRQEFEEAMSKIDPALRPVHYKHYDRFEGNPPGKWSLLRIRPIVLPLRENVPIECEPSYKKKWSPDESKVIDEFIITNLGRRTISKKHSNYLSPLLLVERGSIEKKVQKILDRRAKNIKVPISSNEEPELNKPPTKKKIRVALDYRKVNNSCMSPCRDSVPDIQDILQRCGDSAIASCYDLEQAYYTAPLAEESKKYTGFFYDSQYSTLKGTYTFNVMPFGICSLPSLFSRLVDSCFNGLQKYGSAWFLDDLLQFSGSISQSREANLAQHAKDLDRLFSRAKVYNFKFSISKASIGKSYISFLGFKIGQGQILVSDKTEKGVEAISKIFRVQASAKDFECIFGFLNYSLKFIKNFSQHRNYINKLRELYQKEIEGKKYSFEKREQIAEKYNAKFRVIFDLWKNCILKTRLQIPPNDSEVHLFTDSSDDAFGWCLYDNHGRIVEFGGKTMLPAHKNYCIITKELQAILEACHRLKTHLARAGKIIVYCDNKSAVSFLTKSEKCPSDRIFRLTTRILMFPKLDFTRVDTKSNPADLGSRLIDWEKIEKESDNFEKPINAESIPNFVQPQNNQLDEFLKGRKPPSIEIEQPSIENTLKYDSKLNIADIRKASEIQKDNDSLVQLAHAVKITTNEEFINLLDTVQNSKSTGISFDERKQLATDVHLRFGPHCGSNRLFQIVKFIHPDSKITKKICEEVVKKCSHEKCASRELSQTTTSIRRTGKTPNDVIAIDHFSFCQIKDIRGYTSVLSIRCELSRFAVLIPVYSHAISEVIHNLRLYSNYLGKPNAIRFDNFFDTYQMSNFLEDEGIEKILAPIYRPQANGNVERIHLDLRMCLPIIMEQSKIKLNEWSKTLHVAANFINNSPCRSTGYAPIFLMRGCLPHEFFANNCIIPELKTHWEKAYENSRKNQMKNVHLPPSNKGIAKQISPGTKVLIHLGKRGEKKELALVLKDNGATVLVRKLQKLNRFQEVTVHKSKLSVMLEEDENDAPQTPALTCNQLHARIEERHASPRNQLSRFSKI